MVDCSLKTYALRLLSEGVIKQSSHVLHLRNLCRYHQEDEDREDTRVDEGKQRTHQGEDANSVRSTKKFKAIPTQETHGLATCCQRQPTAAESPVTSAFTANCNSGNTSTAENVERGEISDNTTPTKRPVVYGIDHEDMQQDTLSERRMSSSSNSENATKFLCVSDSERFLLINGKIPSKWNNTERLNNEIPCDHVPLAEKIWKYMLMKHPLQKCDLILILGNIDVRVAEHGAHLWLQGYGKWLMVSGRLGYLTKGKWTRSEADIFREVALRMGVPDNRIIVEECATNTGENISYSFDVLCRLNINPRSIILVQMPFMERRTYATFMKQWPGNTKDLTVIVSSPPISLFEYPNDQIGSLRQVIGIMLGCLKRIKDYPARGFQIHQDIPEGVWEAFQILRKSGIYENFN